MCSGKGKKDSKKPELKESTNDATGSFESAVRIMDLTISSISYLTWSTKLSYFYDLFAQGQK